MKIEVGKRYVMKNGTVTGPLSASNYGTEDDDKFPFVWKDAGHAGREYTFTPRGSYWEFCGPSEYDLVSEYVEPNTTIRDGVPLGVAVPLNAYEQAANDALAEVRRAKDMWPGNFNSAHEGYAVLLEEVDELKAHVWTNQRKRDLGAMRKEAIQVAAMALRFAAECCDEVTGRK